MIKLMIIVLMGIATANAYQPLAISTKCVVAKIEGRFSSYLPPKVGDVILLDTRNPIISQLTFISRSMIPLQKPLKKQSANQWPTHLVTYRSEYGTPDGDVISVVLQVGRFSNNHIQATLQELTRSDFIGLWNMSQMILRCQ